MNNEKNEKNSSVKKKKELSYEETIEQIQQAQNLSKPLAVIQELYHNLYVSNKIQIMFVDDLMNVIRNSLSIDDWYLFVLNTFYKVMHGKNEVQVKINAFLRKDIRDLLISIGMENIYVDNIGSVFFGSNQSSEELKYILKRMDDYLLNKEKIQLEDRTAAAIKYSWIMLKCYEFRSRNFNYSANIIERIFAEYYAGLKEKRVQELTFDNMIALISKKDFCSDFQKMSYLYYDVEDYIKEQEEKKEAAKATIDFLRDSISKKENIIAALEKDIADSKSLINDLYLRISEMKEDIEKERELKEQSDKRVDYERMKYDMQLQSALSGLYNEVENKIGLELQAIEEIAENLDERNSVRISRRVERIRTQVKKMGGK